MQSPLLWVATGPITTHLSAFRGEDAIWDILERFGRCGLPVQMTETTLLSGDLMPPEIVDLNDYQVESWPSTPEGEGRQADEIVRHYRTVVAHPAVESLTYWGFADEGFGGEYRVSAAGSGVAKTGAPVNVNAGHTSVADVLLG